MNSLEVGEIFGSRYYIKQVKSGNVGEVRFNVYQEMSPGGVTNVINGLRRRNKAYRKLEDRELVIKIDEEHYAFLYKFNIDAEVLSNFKMNMNNIKTLNVE